MYIPIWLIIVIAIVAFLYFKSKKQKLSPPDKLTKLEKIIEEMSPTIIKGFQKMRKEQLENLDKFKKGEWPLTTLYSEDKIHEYIAFIDAKLEIPKKYIRLTEKFRHNLDKRLEISVDYYNWLANREKINFNAHATELLFSAPELMKEWDVSTEECHIRLNEIEKRFDELLKD